MTVLKVANKDLIIPAGFRVDTIEVISTSSETGKQMRQKPDLNGLSSEREGKKLPSDFTLLKERSYYQKTL